MYTMTDFFSKHILNENNNKIIGLAHLLFAIFIAFYGIVFKKMWFDYVYIIYAILVLISWTYYNGECPLTYYIKKQQDNSYIAGEESTDINDMYLLFGSKDIIYTIITITIIFNVISEFIVLKRNNYPAYIYFALPFFHFLYTLLLRTQSKLYENPTFLFLQNGFRYIFIVVFIFVFSKIIYK